MFSVTEKRFTSLKFWWIMPMPCCIASRGPENRHAAPAILISQSGRRAPRLPPLLVNLDGYTY
jgi:hypothetical protein